MKGDILCTVQSVNVRVDMTFNIENNGWRPEFRNLLELGQTKAAFKMVVSLSPPSPSPTLVFCILIYTTTSQLG